MTTSDLRLPFALLVALAVSSGCSGKSQPIRRQAAPAKPTGMTAPLTIDPERPGDSEAARALSVAFLLKRAEEALRQRRSADALRDLGTALRNAPGSPRAAEIHLLMGRAQELEGRPEQALAEYEKVVALEPGNPLGHYAVALVLSSLERPGPAVDAMQKAVTLSPRRLVYRFDLVTMLLARDEKQRAEAAFTEYEKIRNDFIAQLRSGPEAQRVDAARELGSVMSDELGLGALAATLADPSAVLRQAAALALGDSGSTAPGVRQALTDALAREKDAKVLETLRAALNALPPPKP
jgi:tetratricopeptide (TPR) repeat protein